MSITALINQSDFKPTPPVLNTTDITLKSKTTTKSILHRQGSLKNDYEDLQKIACQSPSKKSQLFSASRFFSTGLQNPIATKANMQTGQGFVENQITYTDKFTPQQNATTIFNYTLKNEADLRGLLSLIDLALQIGRTPDLSCVFKGPVMDEIIENKEQYTSMDDFFKALKEKQSDLISCLSFSQKIKHGLKIKRLFDRFQSKKPILNKLSNLYGSLRGVSAGVGATDFMSYLFRPDKLDYHAAKLFDTYLSDLRNYVSRLPVKRRFIFFKLN